MKATMIFFNEDRTHVICGGIDSDRYIEIKTNFSVVNYPEVESLLKQVGLSARNVDYKLLGYTTEVWVPTLGSDEADLETEYIITGVAYNIDNIVNGYDFKSIDALMDISKARGDFKRLYYLQRAMGKMKVQ